MKRFVLMSVFLLGLIAHHQAMAATITPNDTSDILSSGDGLCTLREAIINANNDRATYSDCEAGSGADEIVLTGGETYVLTIQNALSSSTSSGTSNSSSGNYASTGDLDIRDDLTISVSATGSSSMATIDGGGAAGVNDRILKIAKNNISVELNDLIIQGGNYIYGSPVVYGGGIEAGVSDATLILNHCKVTGNTLTNSNTTASDYALGGGIYAGNMSILTLNDSDVSNNSAYATWANGGGIYGAYETNINNSSVSGNIVNGSSWNFGGGIYTLHDLNINNSTISGNTATSTQAYGYGGGIYTYASSANEINISNSTISGNSALTYKAGLYAKGGGIYLANTYSTVNMISTILSGNISIGPNVGHSLGEECFSNGNWNSYGYNYVALSSLSAPCVFTEVANEGTDKIASTAADLLLDSLSNDGEMYFHLLLSDSPAVDAGYCMDINGSSVTVDQRSYSRDTQCDIGAYEVNGIPPVDVASSAITSNNGSGSTIPISSDPITGDYSGVSSETTSTQVTSSSGISTMPSGEITSQDEETTTNSGCQLNAMQNDPTPSVVFAIYGFGIFVLFFCRKKISM